MYLVFTFGRRVQSADQQLLVQTLNIVGMQLLEDEEKKI